MSTPTIIPPPPGRVLLKRARGGDVGAWRTLIARHRVRLAGVMLHALWDRADRDEALETAGRHLEARPPDELPGLLDDRTVPFLRWLARLARARARALSAPLGLHRPEGGEARPWLDALGHPLVRALVAVSAAERAVIVLGLFEAQRAVDVARIVGRSPPAARTLLIRACSALGHRLHEEGVR